MGPGRVESVIVDAGPLIHLGEVGCLHLLQIFETLHLPDAVWREVIESQRVAEHHVLAIEGLRRRSVSPFNLREFITSNGYEQLQSGECECLFLCAELDVDILLTDDLAVRKAARAMGWTPVGSLGVVVRAYRMGWLSLAEAETYLLLLHDRSSLFVTPEIVMLAIEQLRGLAS